MDEELLTSTKLTMDSGEGDIGGLTITVDPDHVMFSCPTDVILFTHDEWNVVKSYVAAERMALPLKTSGGTP